MPKFIENYKLEPLENYFSHAIEHFLGKQNGTGKNFILKRFKSEFTPSQDLIPKTTPGSSNQALFQKLTHQTIILKNISHPSIPKCVRMLKTSNSIYFVWQYHPHTSIQQFLRKSWLKIQESTFFSNQEIQISINIIDALIYLHRKNVSHRDLNSENIKIDSKRQIFLTNFTDSFKLDFDLQNYKIQQQIVMERQFQNFIFGDVYDLANLLFDIFQFRSINPKIHLFATNIQRNLFKELTNIMERKIQNHTLENLKRILSEKVNTQETACTEASENFSSPIFKTVVKRNVISRDSDFDKSPRNQRSSVSCTKTTLHNAIKRTQNNRTQMGVSRLSEANIFPSKSFMKASALSISPNSKTEITQKSISIWRYASEFKKIIRNRKLINLFLECLKFISKLKNIKLIYLLGLKCEFFTEHNRRLIGECSSNHLDKKEMDFLKVINSENMKTQDFLSQLKVSIKKIVKDNIFSNDSLVYESFDEAAKKRDTETMDKNLSREIYNFLDDEIYPYKGENMVENPSEYSTEPELRSPRRQVKASKDLLRTKAKRTVSIIESFAPNQEFNYKDYKFYYYLSIQLKYGSFEKFFEAEVNEYNNFKVHREEHFWPFENHTVPVKQIALEVKYRMEKYAERNGI